MSRQLAAQIRPLEQLETERVVEMGVTGEESAVPLGTSQKIHPRGAAAEANPARPGVWISEQVKYAEDVLRGTASWWRRLYFWYVFRPLVLFSYKVAKVYPPDGRDHNGFLIWLDRQGAYNTEWKAVQDSARYRFGFATWLPLDESVESGSCETIQITPNLPKRFSRNGCKTVDIHALDLKQLDETGRAADVLIEQHKSAKK